MKRSTLALVLSLSLSGLSPTPATFAAAWFAEEGASRSSVYREGQKALSEERWEQALQIFTSLADSNPAEADAALYWKAWTESRLSRRGDALQTLRGLVSNFPKSAWIDDAKALEIELKGKKGQGGSTSEQGDDEDLKLYALDGLMQVDPDRAVPILERFLAADHSMKLKERALFVLAQSGTPRARQILLDLVRRGSPAELRLRAVQELGIAGDSEDLAALATIWKEGTPEVKEKVLDSWMIAGQKKLVFDVARSEADPRLRQKAIELLGVMDATEELTALYGQEKDVQVRGKLLEAYGVAGDIEALEKAYRSESDLSLRGKALEGIGVFGGDDGTKTLVGLYQGETERALKEKMLEGLFIGDAARELVELFRKEKDSQLKRSIVQKLSLMDDEEAEKVLSEILGDGQ